MDRNDKLCTYLTIKERDFILAASRLLGLTGSTFLRLSALRLALEIGEGIPEAKAAFEQSALKVAIEEAEQARRLLGELTVSA